MKIILPYVKRHEKFKKAVDSIKKYCDGKKFNGEYIELVEIYDEHREGFDKIISDCFKEYDEDLILWHSDIYMTENFIDDLMKYYDQFDIIGTKLLYPNGAVQHYGGFIRFDGAGVHPHGGFLNYGLDKPQECVFVTFGACLIKRKVFKKYDMDSLFFPSYFGDVDYCMRARKEFKVGVVPATAIHEETSDNKMDKEQQQKFFRNYKNFKTKWMNELSTAL